MISDAIQWPVFCDTRIKLKASLGKSFCPKLPALLGDKLFIEWCLCKYPNTGTILPQCLTLFIETNVNFQ